MARRSVIFDLADEERATLNMWVASHKTEQRLSRWAQVILLSVQGSPDGLILTVTPRLENVLTSVNALQHYGN